MTTTTSGSAVLGTVPFEPLFVTVPAVRRDVTVTPPPTASPPTASPPTGPGRRSFGRRHRVGLVVVAAIVVVVASGAGVFVYKWNHTNPHQLSTGAAYQQFRSGITGKVVDPGTLHPAQGVYRYTGSAHESVSLPPKSQSEGPGMPGTVSYQPDGCWVWRLDDSDSHWQSSTFCPRRGNLVEVGRAGWYRWNFVALVIADTATFTCTPEVALPALLMVGQQFPFTCRGTNSPIRTSPVTMAGTNRYMGEQTLRVGDSQVTALHFREVSVFSGGQTGTNVADTWFSTVNGLPVHGTWRTEVHSPTALGTSTLTGSGSFSLASSTPRS
jgi:hypothetical protein